MSSLELIQKKYPKYEAFALEAFAAWCERMGLDPLGNEVTCLAFYSRKTETYRYQYVVNYHKILAWSKEAPDYKGYLLFEYYEVDGKLVVLSHDPSERKTPIAVGAPLVAVECQIHFKNPPKAEPADYRLPVSETVWMDEWIDLESHNWNKRPRFMLGVVALRTAHKRAYPEKFFSVITPEEADEIGREHEALRAPAQGRETAAPPPPPPPAAGSEAAAPKKSKPSPMASDGRIFLRQEMIVMLRAWLELGHEEFKDDRGRTISIHRTLKKLLSRDNLTTRQIETLLYAKDHPPASPQPKKDPDDADCPSCSWPAKRVSDTWTYGCTNPLCRKAFDLPELTDK